MNESSLFKAAVSCMSLSAERGFGGANFELVQAYKTLRKTVKEYTYLYRFLSLFISSLFPASWDLPPTLLMVKTPLGARSSEHFFKIGALKESGSLMFSLKASRIMVSKE